MRGSVGDEHAVAVGVEAVAFADGFVVGGKDEFAAGEGTDEHEEGGAGEVEIGDERPGLLEFLGRMDEDAGAAGARLDGAGGWDSSTRVTVVPMATRRLAV